jgi:ribosomal protein L37AE/L43A
MEALLRNPTNLSIGCSQDCISIAINRVMIMRHTCLCCSNTLLRHTRLKGLYWRCSHCNQEMPV